MDVQNFLTNKVGNEGLPILDEEEWIFAHRELSDNDDEAKHLFRRAVAKWIVTNKPPYPRKISLRNPEQSNKKFLELCAKNMSAHIKSKDQTKDVLEKFDDYNRPYSTHGLGVIDCGSEFNIVSDYDMYEERMKCGSTHSDSPIVKWQDEDVLTKLFMYFHRMGNQQLQLGTYIGAFRLGSYLATQFKPSVAKAVYQMTDAKKVLDTSCGWGDRLTAFYATGQAEEYIGCDPNGDVWKKYQDLCVRYERLLSRGNQKPKISVYDNYFVSEGKKKVTIYRSGAEDLPWDKITDIDCSFTSPPYFATELYGQGGDFEDDQSWKKFGEYESWRDQFFIPVSENSYKSLKEGGFCLINILDPVVKGKRYRAGDDLIDYMEENHPNSFLGQIGMRYMQRPKTSKLDIDEDISEENLDLGGGLEKQKRDPKKEKLDKFLAKCYIENVWTFCKGESKIDLFKGSNIEGFFS